MSLRFQGQPKPHVPACRYDAWPYSCITKQKCLELHWKVSHGLSALGRNAHFHVEHDVDRYLVVTWSGAKDLADVAGYCAYEGTLRRPCSCGLLFHWLSEGGENLQATASSLTPLQGPACLIVHSSRLARQRVPSQFCAVLGTVN